MPYCSKCGVEVENDVKHCPLCEYQIPKINKLKKYKLREEFENKKFPLFKNMYFETITRVKNTIFLALSVVILMNEGLLVYFLVKSNPNITPSLYGMIILAAIWIYIFLILDFLKSKTLMTLGIILNTAALTFFCDFLTGKLDWFFFVSLPGIILGIIILIILSTIIYFIKKKTINILLIISTGFSFFLIGLEIIIQLYFFKNIFPFISIVISTEIMAVSIFILFFYNKIPQEIFDKLRKKMHI